MEQVDDIAATSLIRMSTMGRDVDYETVSELVGAVVKSDKYRFHLPLMIMWMRNHAKSLAAGCGAG
eukprot:CAMPEP_0113695276 /NCGR_PEP_ID=MMETSP0038_2-20120614/20810_1 /TAXON_ID=2898 /ORGANISM="Cryptomonas paramecium" /LENGTH=65 /DNA_ID=CAMNT_0000617801 /DNA_START=16 /DNA_END=209 /DNA_ORIENTATION=- /assembly_acc=CAM_ASM_000170